MDVKEVFIEGAPSHASRVMGGLWVGGAPPPGPMVSQHFNCLVLCANEYQLDETFFPGVEVLHAPMNDDGTPMSNTERQIAVATAGKVINRLSRGQRVLVTCRQGRNRSGLVACLAMSIGPPSLHPSDAINRLRMIRGHHAMVNKDFQVFLFRYASRFARRAPESHAAV